jgi:predicted O-methyltransferase YrrM
MQHEDLCEYINSVYGSYPIITAEEYIKNTNIKSFCPVIDTPVAMFLKLILEIKHPDRVLELGTSIGYSSIIIASTIKKWNGKLITIENDEKIAEVAKINFEKYGLSKSIEIIIDDAIQYMNKINDDYDFIFLDLYNDLYPEAFNYCLKLLNPEGILIADDTLFPIIKKDEEYFKESNKKLDTFNKMVSDNQLIESVLLPFGDGVTLIKKKGKGA